MGAISSAAVGTSGRHYQYCMRILMRAMFRSEQTCPIRAISQRLAHHVHGKSASAVSSTIPADIVSERAARVQERVARRRGESDPAFSAVPPAASSLAAGVAAFPCPSCRPCLPCDLLFRLSGRSTRRRPVLVSSGTTSGGFVECNMRLPRSSHGRCSPMNTTQGRPARYAPEVCAKEQSREPRSRTLACKRMTSPPAIVTDPVRAR